MDFLQPCFTVQFAVNPVSSLLTLPQFVVNPGAQQTSPPGKSGLVLALPLHQHPSPPANPRLWGTAWLDSSLQDGHRCWPALPPPPGLDNGPARQAGGSAHRFLPLCLPLPNTGVDGMSARLEGTLHQHIPANPVSYAVPSWASVV